MDIDSIIDDVVIYKTRVLSYDERDDIIDEIFIFNEKLKPLKTVEVERHVLEFQDDSVILEILSNTYLLYTIKYFQEVSYDPPRTNFNVIDIKF